MTGIASRMLGVDLLVGSELKRETKVRYCKTCKLVGKKVPLNAYNKRDECLRHPLPESMSCDRVYVDMIARQKKYREQRKARKESAQLL